MPLCPTCGLALQCTNPSKHADTPVAKGCPLKEGAIWVHVMSQDDVPLDLADAEITIDGETDELLGKGLTLAGGFARFDPLPTGKLTVTLASLTGKLVKEFLPPLPLRQPVGLVPGEIAYVSFALPRKPKLAVVVREQGKPAVVFARADVHLDGKGRRTEKAIVGGVADFGPCEPDDAYTITADLHVDDQKTHYCPPAVPVALKAGEVRTVPFEVLALARPIVEVVWDKGAQKVENVGVKLTGGLGITDFGTTALVSGLAPFPALAAGLRAGLHDIEVAFDADVYKPSWATPKLTFDLAAGSVATERVTLIKLARPTLEIGWSPGAAHKLDGIKVKLKAGVVEHDLGTTAATGLAALVALKGVEPDVDHDLLLEYPEKHEHTYALASADAKLKFAEGFAGTKTITLVKLARPKLKVVEDATGIEVEGIAVKLTATSDGTTHDLDATGRSGMAAFAPRKLGLWPGKHTLAVSAAGFVPALVSPADITVTEGSRDEIVVKVTTPKATTGTLRVRVGRYDGQELGARVTVKVAKASAPGVVLKTATTAKRDVEVEREYGRKITGKEDFVEIVDLPPETYRLVVDDLVNNVLKKQDPPNEWRLGPSQNGQVDVAVVAGRTAEIVMTVSRYERAQFIGFNVLPGYKEGFRCPTCLKQYDGDGHCNVPACAGVKLKGKRCSQCNVPYDGADTKCATCSEKLSYWCDVVTCSKRCAHPGDCPTCATPVQYTCNECYDVRPGLGQCPTPACAGTLAYYCNTCMANQAPNAAGDCPSCTNAIHVACDTCPKLYRYPGLCWNGCKLDLFPERTYLGRPTNREDLFARCLVLEKAIDTARPEADATDDVLKIFMGPEFYFRGLAGGYPVADLSLIMDRLRNTTKDLLYKDWLFVFGTAIGYLPLGPSPDSQRKLRVAEAALGTTQIKVTHGLPPRPDRAIACEEIPAENQDLPAEAQWQLELKGRTATKRLVKTVTKVDADHYHVTLDGAAVDVDKDDECVLHEPVATELFNVALVQKGGPDAGVTGLRELLVYKETVSHIDFLRDKRKTWNNAQERQIFLHDKQPLALPTEGANQPLGRRANPLSGEANRSGFGGGSIFMVDGVTVGLEVCLDHDRQKVQKYFAAAPAGTAKMQVHLIPSWGSSIKANSLAGMVDTLVFNVDGPKGSDAAKVTTLLPLASAPLTRKDSYPVGVVAKADVDYTDTSGKPAPAQQKDVDPQYPDLLTKREHKIANVATGKGKGYAWVDVFDVADLPPAETT